MSEAINGIRVRDHLGLVHAEVKRYRWACGGALEEEDLFQAGVIGLIRGLERFDVGRGLRISTYVRYWIRNGMQREVMNHSRTVRVSVWRWQAHGAPARELSLDAVDAEQRPLLELASVAPEPDSLLGEAREARRVRAALERVPERLRAIVEATVVDGTTLAEVGQQTPGRSGSPISRERARQLREEGLCRLRGELEEKTPRPMGTASVAAGMNQREFGSAQAHSMAAEAHRI